MKIIKYNGLDHKIFINGVIGEDDIRVITVPQSLLLQDSIEEMLEDIGEFNMQYLQEVLNDNATFNVA